MQHVEKFQQNYQNKTMVDMLGMNLAFMLSQFEWISRKLGLLVSQQSWTKRTF